MRSHRSGQNVAGVILTVMCFSMMDKRVFLEMILEILWIQCSHFAKLLSGEFLELEIWLECLRCRATWMSTKHHLFGRMPPSFPMNYGRSKMLCYHFIYMLKFSRTTSWEIWIEVFTWQYHSWFTGKTHPQTTLEDFDSSIHQDHSFNHQPIIARASRYLVPWIHQWIQSRLWVHGFQAATRQKTLADFRKFPPPPITVCKWKWDNWTLARASLRVA